MKNISAASSVKTSAIPSIKATTEDDLVLAKGFTQSLLISWKDKISDVDYFGFNCESQNVNLKTAHFGFQIFKYLKF